MTLATSFLYYIQPACEIEEKAELEKISRPSSSERRVEVIDRSHAEFLGETKEDFEMSVIETREQLMEALAKAKFKEAYEKDNGKPITLDIAMGLISRRHQGRAKHDKELENKYFSDMEGGAIFPAGKACVNLKSFEIDLYDGNHTWGALRQRKAKSMSLSLVPGNERLARLWSLGVNDTHGSQASDDDRIHGLRILLDDPE